MRGKGKATLANWNARRAAREREYERQQVREALARTPQTEFYVGSRGERFLTETSAKREDELLYGRSTKG